MDRTLLLRLPVEEVQTLAQSGQIGEEEVLEYTGVKHLEQGGHFLDLDVDQAQVLHQHGHLSEEQTERYLDYQESPGMFYAKDILYGVGRGVTEAFDEVQDRATGLLTWLFPETMAEQFARDQVDPEKLGMTPVLLPEQPDTLPGQFTEEITQFSTAFIPYFGAANKVMQMGRLAKFSQSAPKFAKFIAGQVASLGATATVTDLWEDRLSNLIAEATPDSDAQLDTVDLDAPMAAIPTSLWLDPIVNYLKADKGDSGAQAVLKAVLEDQLLGVLGEGGVELAKGLFHSFRAIKGQLLVKHGGDTSAVTKEVEEVAESIAERHHIVESEHHPVNKASKWEPPDAQTGVSKVPQLVKRRVNKPERWMYISETDEAPIRKKFSEKQPVSPNGEKTFTGFIAADTGQLVPVVKGSSEAEVARRLNMVKTNRATAELYTRSFEKDGYSFENFRKAVSGDQTIVDFMSDTSVYRVESTRLAPGETTPNVSTAKLKPLPEVKVEAKETAQVRRAVEAQTGLPLREAPQIPQTVDEAVELFREQAKVPVKPTLEISAEEMPEVTATVMQLAKGMLSVENVSDYKLLMDEGYPIAGLTAKESREFTGFNMKRFLAPENSQQIITHIYREFKERIAEAKGGAVVHMKDTDDQALARLSQWTGIEDAYSSLKALKVATDDLPTAVRAAEVYFTAYSALLGKFAQNAVTMEDKLLVQEMTATFAEVLTILHGAKANIGRALNIQKMMKGGDRYGFHLLDPETIKDIYQNVGHSADQLTEQLASLGTLKNPKVIAQFVRKYHGIRLVDGIVELKLASMLSAPVTWAKNLFGTLGRMVHEEFNMDVALMLQGVQDRDAEMFKEVYRRWSSQMYALVDALGAVKSWKGIAEALKDGKGLGTAAARGWQGFAESNFWQALKSGDNVLDPVPKWGFGGAIPNFKWLPLGDIIRLPFHILSATDEVLQCVSYAGALRHNAVQEGLERGLSGKDLVRHAASLIDKPSKEFHQRALHDSRWMIFKANLEGKQKAFHDWLNDVRGSHPVTKVAAPLLRSVFLPFDKVVFNILNSVGDTIPIFSKKFRADWAEGGVKRKAAILRVATGCTMFYIGAQLYADGKLRGATPYRDKATAQALHMPDNAYFDSSTGEWKTLTGLDPAAMYFTIGANVAHLMDVVGHMDPETENKAQLAVTQGMALLAEAVAYAPGMEGAHDFLKILFDPGGTNKLGRMAVSQAGTFSPYGGLQKYVSNLTQDPEYRQLGSAFDSWQNVMNGLWNQYWNKEGMLPRRHVLFGERTEQFEGYTIWGGQQKAMMLDPSLIEIADIHMALDRMDDKVTVDGITKRFTPEQMDEAEENLTLIEGIPGVKGLRGTLNHLVSLPEYQSIHRPEDRQRVLRNVISKFRSAAKKMVLATDGQLREQVLGKLQQRIGEQMGILAVPEDYGTVTHNIRNYLQGQMEDQE